MSGTNQMVFNESDLQRIRGFEPNRNGAYAMGVYTIDRIAGILTRFASNRKYPFYRIVGQTCLLQHLPPYIVSCELKGGKNQVFQEGKWEHKLTGDEVHAQAILSYTSGITETIDIKNSTDMCKFLAKWIGLKYYTDDEWTSFQAEEVERIRHEEEQRKIAVRRKQNKLRIQAIFREHTRKMVAELVEELNSTELEICMPDGKDEKTSVVAACKNLDMSIEYEITQAMSYARFPINSRLDQADACKILSTVDRFFQIAL